MGKVLKVREVGEPILNKKCDEVDIKKINDEILDIIEDLKSTLEYGTGVERYKNIELTYYNENGEKIVKQLNGFFARLVQHECDHLDGIVFLEKVKEHNGFATKENIDKYNLRNKK